MQKFSCASISIPFLLAFSLGTTVACYWWTWHNDDFIHTTAYPYVSDLGNAYPQSIMFRVAFSWLTVYLFYITTLRILQLWTAFPYQLHPALFVLVACYSAGYICVIGLAYFNNRDHESPHYTFALGAFVLILTFQITHTVLSFMGHRPDIHFSKCFRPSPDWVLTYNCVCNIVSVLCACLVSIFPDRDLGTISESILIFTILAYYLAWVAELRLCTLSNLFSSAATAHLFRDVDP